MQAEVADIEVVKADYHNIQHQQDILQLLKGYALDPMGGGEALSEYTQLNLLENLAKLPHAFSVIAYKNKKAVGLINCFEAFSTFRCQPLINIHDVVVIGDARGSGISQKMLDKVEQIAIEKGCCKITLEVLGNNIIAKSAYQKFGFSAFTLDESVGSAEFWQKCL